MKTYDYNGALEPINVKVIRFNNGSPDFIFSADQWKDEGGYHGILKSQVLYIRDIEKVITGTMCPIEFENLEEWDG